MGRRLSDAAGQPLPKASLKDCNPCRSNRLCLTKKNALGGSHENESSFRDSVQCGNLHYGGSCHHSLSAQTKDATAAAIKYLTALATFQFKAAYDLVSPDHRRPKPWPNTRIRTPRFLIAALRKADKNYFDTR